ncbi:hypothetical protein [Rhizobium rhizogenes]|uniref:hypothetical protein n=1 Tax=Rhizobium rhizogenes TaxID=359 RepID=UPI0024BE4DC2|nr:hypothetical protein [Rhizobium rhizogenes]MDJ1634565.1 hypothetical protein [Rhizobium rhizogenes]
MFHDTKVLLGMIIFFAVLSLIAMFDHNVGGAIACIGFIIVLAAGTIWEQRSR